MHFQRVPHSVPMNAVADRSSAMVADKTDADHTRPAVALIHARPSLVLPGEGKPLDPSIATRRPTRRQVMAVAAMSFPPVATTAVSLGSVSSLYGRRVRQFTLNIPQLPPQLDGMTIAHVSDTHIGKFLHHSRLPAIADDINRLDADFIVFTGDLIDIALEDLTHGIKFLRSLRSRCGMVVCEGNHDVMQDRDSFEDKMRKAQLPFVLGSEMTLLLQGRQAKPAFLFSFSGRRGCRPTVKCPNRSKRCAR